MEERIRVCFGWMNLEGLESPILLYTMRPLQAKSLFSLSPLSRYSLCKPKVRKRSDADDGDSFACLVYSISHGLPYTPTRFLGLYLLLSVCGKVRWTVKVRGLPRVF